MCLIIWKAKHEFEFEMSFERKKNRIEKKMEMKKRERNTRSRHGPNSPPRPNTVSPARLPPCTEAMTTGSRSGSFSVSRSPSRTAAGWARFVSSSGVAVACVRVVSLPWGPPTWHICYARPPGPALGCCWWTRRVRPVPIGGRCGRTPCCAELAVKIVRTVSPAGAIYRKPPGPS